MIVVVWVLIGLVALVFLLCAVADDLGEEYDRHSTDGWGE